MAGARKVAMSRFGHDAVAATDVAGLRRPLRHFRAGFSKPEFARLELEELTAPLERLLISSGDARLSIDPETGCNQYGCRPLPSSGHAGFSSSTATSISQRAYDRTVRARDRLLQSAVGCGLDEARDSRIEAMRDELIEHLGLADTGAELVFSVSGTDSQLQALLLAQHAVGGPVTTIVVAADQTGSGTVHTARGHHFSNLTGNGVRVRQGEPIDEMGGSVASIAISSLDQNGEALPSAEVDLFVLSAVQKAIAGGSKVLLQTMDSSKFGHRFPSDECVRQITTYWPDAVQIVVDACQMRLGRRRLRDYLTSGFMVLMTGSKFFAGPPFSGALLLPAKLSDAIASIEQVPCGMLDYSARSDWPKRWVSLRQCFEVRHKFGQWLRWEAALEEIRAYYAVPDDFRSLAIQQLGAGIAHIIDASSSFRRLNYLVDSGRDQETERSTIFPFTIVRDGRTLSLQECRKIHQALRAKDYMIGQPVGWDNGSSAALRFSISARHIIESWSRDRASAIRNLKAILAQVSAVTEELESILIA